MNKLRGIPPSPPIFRSSACSGSGLLQTRCKPFPFRLGGAPSMSALGQKLTSRLRGEESAKCQKRTFELASELVAAVSHGPALTPCSGLPEPNLTAERAPAEADAHCCVLL